MESGYIKLKQIKPVVSGYIRKSQILLKKSDIPDDKDVHDIRVLMKKSISVLKLIGQQTDNPFHQRDLDELKHVGKILRNWRDTSVCRKTLKELKKENPAIFKNLNNHSKLQYLLDRPDTVDDISPEMKSVLAQIDELLNKTIYRIRFQDLSHIDPNLLLKELEYTYGRVADAFIRCRNKPRPIVVHKFRKLAKDFHYQLFIFRSLNPSNVRNLEKKLETLTINLGKFNDLVQVIKSLGYKYNRNSDSASLDELILKIREKQDKYLNRVWAASFKLFGPGQKLVNILGFKLLVI